MAPAPLSLAQSPPPGARLSILACATVIEEMLPILPPGARYQVLEYGLHLRPDNLRAALQSAVAALEAEVADEPDRQHYLLLGYGLCSRAVVGLVTRRATLVVPRVDDCIALFLGSRAAYRQQSGAEPGTYYLTKGWIEVADSPFSEYERMAARYGPARAERMTRLMLKHYTRLAFINTGREVANLEHYQGIAREAAAKFDLRYEEIDGSPALVRKLLYGPWDDEIVVAPPGETLTYDHFVPQGAAGAGLPCAAPGPAGPEARP